MAFYCPGLGVNCLTYYSYQLFYLGSFVDGALGSNFTLALAITAVIADITPVPEARALRFAVVEGTLFTAGALAQVGDPCYKTNLSLSYSHISHNILLPSPH